VLPGCAAVITTAESQHDGALLRWTATRGVLDDGEDARDIELGRNSTQLADRCARRERHLNCV
jgi:hypothetical protein